MLCYIRNIITFLMMLLYPILAQGQKLLDPYFIANIEMRAFDRNEVKAKEKAITQAQQEAYDILMQRLIYDGQKRLDINYIGERYIELPYLSKIPFLDDNQHLTDFIQSQSIREEKFGGGHYFGFLDIQFNAFQIHDFLEKRKIKFIDKASLPLVIFPIVKSRQEYSLWQHDTTNTWYETWRTLPFFNSIVPILLPAGDKFDYETIPNPETILSNGILESNIKKLLWRYRAGGYAIALLEKLRDGSNRDYHQLRLIIRAPGWNLNQLLTIDPYIGNLTDQKQYQRYLAYRLRQQIEDLWHQLHYQQDDVTTQDSIDVIVKINDFTSWLTLRKNLYLAIGKDYTAIHTITLNQANLTLDYQNDIQTLITTLAQYNLQLEYNKDQNTWFLEQISTN